MKTPELLPCPHDGSKVEFCDECDGGCHRIIGNGIEIDLLPTIRQGDSLENRRVICAERWNTRVYPAEVQAAIERDAPKKLIFPTVKKKSEEKEDMPRCPACEKLLGKVAGRTRHTYPCKGGARTIECNLYEWDVQTFCPECGQRLDWSEE